ncbi:MAG: carboxypeptidase regulatory-like domain-containing protein [Gemmatimonadetes bacterium]|nr:carboxypeptidase regulatory-like domain-containing protein [Gemmatimonadota bacterium]
MATASPCTNHRRVALLAAVLLIAGTPAAAQLVTGVVVEGGTELPVAGASLELMDTTGLRRGSAVADTAGAFRIMVPQPGVYWLKVSHIAYTSAETVTFSAAVGVEVKLELRMMPSAVALEPLRVVGRSDYNAGWLQEYYERAVWTRRSGMGRVFFRDEVERANLPTTSTFLTYLLPRAGCRPSIFVDGLQMQDASQLDGVLQPQALEGVELYNNRVFLPDRYANRGHCAVALFWTRRDLEGARPMTWRRALVTGGVIAGLLLLLQL